MKGRAVDEEPLLARFGDLKAIRSSMETGPSGETASG